MTQNKNDFYSTARLSTFVTLSLGLFVFAILAPWVIGLVVGLAGMNDVPDLINKILEITRSGSYIAVAITFIGFLRMSFRNLTPLNVEGKKNKEWYAFAGFIVPIANFVVPCSMTDEIWRGSDPSTLDPIKWKECKHSTLIYLWWGFWLSHGLTRLFALYFKKSEIGVIANSIPVQFFAEISLAISSLLLIKVVTDISKRQSQKHNLLLKLTSDDVALP